jgi:Family of unknown function (DUF6687)
MVALARRFQFVAESESYGGDRPAISCDGLVPGASLDLSHWQGNRTPLKYKADTSTEIALNFAASPEACDRWADAVVVNNHFDTDGILSIWVLLDPERAAASRDLLVAAALAGDFDEWPALARGLWLDAAIRALGSGAADHEEAYAKVLPQLPELVRSLDERRDLWGQEWDDLQASIAALDSGLLRAERREDIGIMIHKNGQPEVPGPVLARRFLPGARRYLLVFEREGGYFDYRYERPHYAWADTVIRRSLPEPDAAALADALGPEWSDAGLPGMTGIVRTVRASNEPLEVLTHRLVQLDRLVDS